MQEIRSEQGDVRVEGKVAVAADWPVWWHSCLCLHSRSLWQGEELAYSAAGCGHYVRQLGLLLKSYMRSLFTPVRAAIGCWGLAETKAKEKQTRCPFTFLCGIQIKESEIITWCPVLPLCCCSAAAAALLLFSDQGKSFVFHLLISPLTFFSL